MDFDLNEEQIMLQDSARKFFRKEVPKDLIRGLMHDEKGYSPEIWKKMAELGWMGLPFGEENGGYGGTFLDLAVILEEIGRSALSSPYFSTVVVCGLLLQDCASREMKQEYIPKIVAGNCIASLALIGKNGDYSRDAVGVEAESSGNNYKLNGSAFFVPYAHVADNIICASKTPQGITLFMLDAEAAGIEAIRLKTITGEAHDCIVNLKNVEVASAQVVGEVGKGWDYIETLLPKVSVGLSCESVGGMSEVMEFTIDHLNQRRQFGRPLSAFQAVQHYCSDMAIMTESSRQTAYYAAWLISEGLECKKDAAIAKAWCGEAYKNLTKIAHQVTGGIGFTEEYDLHLFSKNAKKIEVLFGNGAFHRNIVADEMEL